MANDDKKIINMRTSMNVLVDRVRIGHQRPTGGLSYHDQ
jgi:hypothetical protein